MKNNMKINRRDFIKSSVLAGGALLVQSGIPAAAAGMVAGNAVDDAPQDAGDGLLKGVCDIHLPCLWGEGMQMAQYKRQSAGEFAAFARINPSRSFITTERGDPASSCVGCGECLAKCPQHLDIPNLLARVKETMGK